VGALVRRHKRYIRRCVRLNRRILPYVSTANVARDMARPVDGDDAPAAAVQAVYAKQLWPVLAAALASADRGDGTGLRALADFFYGWLPGGTYDPLLDRYFTISALEQRYLSKVRRYLREGRRSYRSYDHA
jgi:hypothetical protein